MKRILTFTSATLVASQLLFVNPAQAFYHDPEDGKEHSHEQQQVQQKFDQYVDALKQEALDKGYQQQTLDQAFADIEYYQRAVELDKNQPEFRVLIL